MNLNKRIDEVEAKVDSLNLTQQIDETKWGRVPVVFKLPGDEAKLKEFQDFIKLNNIESNMPLYIVVEKLSI